MAALSTAHKAALSALIDACPDATLSRLVQVVPRLQGDRAAELKALFETAGLDRRRRAMAFAPILPLFRPRADGVEGLVFPRPVLARLWSAAAADEAGILSLLELPEADHAAVGDRLCRAAAGALRDRPREIWPEDLQPDLREAGLAELTGCLDLSHLVRRALGHLETWLTHPDDAERAALRLLLKDATAVAPDGAHRFMEMVFAHLDDASAVLRIVTQTSGSAARESFLGGTEMADFVSRLVQAVERRSAVQPDPSGGAEAALTVARELQWCAGVLAQLDLSLEHDPQGQWTSQARALRQALSSRLSAWFAATRKAMVVALPRERAPGAARSLRPRPSVGVDLPAGSTTAALTWLALVGHLRGVAGVFGAETERRALCEALTAELTDWADEALQLINAGEAVDEVRALDHLDRVADWLDALEAEEAARTVRRRVAVAGSRRDEGRASPRFA